MSLLLMSRAYSTVRSISMLRLHYTMDRADENLVTVGLTELLAKDSNSYDPASVINISSTASVDPHSEDVLSAEGDGTWSCTCLLVLLESSTSHP